MIFYDFILFLMTFCLIFPKKRVIGHVNLFEKNWRLVKYHWIYARCNDCNLHETEVDFYFDKCP